MYGCKILYHLNGRLGMALDETNLGGNFEGQISFFLMPNTGSQTFKCILLCKILYRNEMI